MSNTTIQIKRSANTATPNTLSAGELAYSYASNTLFIGDANGNSVIAIATSNTVAGINAAYAQANAAYAQANAAYAQANVANVSAQSAYSLANTANNTADAAYAQANVANTNAQTAISLAISANTEAQSAYALANAAFSANGGTINGDVVITGNLTVNGVVTMTIDGGTF